MTKRMTDRRRIFIVLIMTGMIATMLGSALARQDLVSTNPGSASFGKPTEISMTRAASTNIDLRNLPKTPPQKFERPEREEPEIERTAIPNGIKPPSESITPSVPVQSAPAPPPIMTFDGLDFANWGAGHPPDTNGDVGPTYYIQTINTSIGVFRKSDGVRVAAFTFNTLMSQGGFGDVRDTGNFGDPVVLYDTFEDRWIISDFAFSLDGGGNVVNPPGSFQVFAVSKTGDPVMGGWNFYSINTTGGLGDYPKLGIWPDGLYMSVNMFNYNAGGAFQNPRVYAFNKAQMYAGKPTVQVVTFNGPSADFTLLPSNARLQVGTPPPGTPNYFISTWLFTNALTVYKFHVDWNRISLSTFTGPDTPLASTSWPNATVPNAPSQGGNALDVLQIRAMVQNQYSNIGGVESLWATHTVRRGNTTGFAAPRWYQVDVTGGTVNPNIPQAATWDPDGANVIYRFMPSVAVDRAGDMALGYSTSNSTTKPALKYAGRLSSDPINTLGQTETLLFQGTGTQTGNCGSSACTRWGDYSSMTLDPDGCTFWYTNEYYAVDGLNHQTRIGSFAFPSCTPVGAGGTVSGTVTAAAGGAPLSGATVQLGARSTTTDGLGAYSFLNIPAGTYPGITASFPGYVTGTASNIVVTDGNTTTQNFSLATAPTSACLTDTTQSDFQTGVTTNVDLTTSPGDAILSVQLTIDQNTAGTTTGTGFGTPAWTGQTFIPSATGSLTKADVQLFCNGCGATPPNLTLSVRATSGGLPTGADLTSATIPGSVFASGGTVTYTSTFGSPVTLTSGMQYSLILRPVSAPAGSGYFWIRSSPSTYANGQRVLSADSGSTWSADSTRDYNFKAYIATGYSASGNLISSLKDSNPAAGLTPIWSTLSWNGSTPANTLLRFQMAGSNSDSGPFNFVGPDGTAATFFTTSPASLNLFYGFRYLQYKAYLDTTDSAQTPALNDVTLCYADTDCSGTVTITPTPAQVCANSTGNTASGPAGATSYSWSITNGTITSSTTSQSVTYTAGASGSVGLMLDIVEPGGCHKSGSVNVPINPIPPTPTITPAGSTTICPNGTLTLTSSSESGNQWYLNGNPISGATSQQYIATASGDYTVIVTIGGCSSAASAATTLTVGDTQPPTVTCPAPIVQSADPNVCTAVVTFADPTVTDNCPPCNVGNEKPGQKPSGFVGCTVVCSPASGSTFSKGVTTVSCTATDASNNTANCAFTVTVNDTQAPVITCPLPITQNTDPNVCTAVVTFADPVVTDNCPPCNVGGSKPGQNINIGCSVVCSPASGAMFPKGVTTVTCTATDASNNTAQCSFTVTVNDMEAPTITCPAPVVRSTDPNVCSTVVTYGNAEARDNCPGVGTPSCLPASGTAFAKGVTTVTCTVSDASSNSNTCMFTVTVNDTQAPTVTCPPSGGAFAASDCLPSQRSAYTGATLYSVGPNTVTNAVLSNFTPCTPPPVSGMATINFTGILTGDLTTGGPVTHFQAPVIGSMKVTFNNLTGATRTFDTEMLQLDLSGGNLPAGVQLRESPTLVSTGQTKITTVTGGFHIDSFFDVFTELSTNGGANWTPDPTPRHISAVQSTDAGACNAVVNYADATATDNCPGVSAVTCVPASGTTFAKGTTTVTCSATDGAHLLGNCSFMVTVIDAQLPTLTCPNNISVTGNTCQNVSYATPVPNDNCPSPTAACFPASGTCFGVGTTTVTCTATDMSANISSCTFTVSVIPCTITCPNNVVVNAAPGVCTAVATFADPTTTGSCGTVTCTPSSGATFQKGVTTVTCSTTAGPSCAFTVTVNDTQPPVITCPGPVVHSTDPNVCTAVVTFADPTVTDNCPPCNSGGTKPGQSPNFQVGCQVVCSPASGSTFQKGVTTVTCTATDASNNTSMCMFTVTVNDVQPPAITCLAAVVQSTDPNVCTALVTYSNATATDNCPGVGTPVCTPASGTTFQKGVTTVSCSVSDASNNTANCTFTVTINDMQPPVVTCPNPITQNTDPNVCTAVVTFADPTVTDNCPPCDGSGTKPGKPGKNPKGTTGCTVVCVPASGSTFQKGVTTVTCTATDASNNTAMCSFTVTVNDTQNPSVTCPANIPFTTPGNNDPCGVVTYATPAGSDNCPLGPNPVSCTPASGTCFQVGMTTVTCTVTDTSNRTGQCTFKVTVQNPCTITCPANITRGSDPNQCGAVVTFAPMTTGGGCGTVACSPASGSFFPKGTTTVLCTTAGPSCSFTVTVNDTQPPNITCPANIIKGTDLDQCQAVVTYPAPTVSDNCPGMGPPTCSPASGTIFPKGSTTVTCTVKDSSNNMSMCSFTITVNDNQPPVLVGCPAGVFKAAEVSCPITTTLIVSYTTPTATDNCAPPPTVICNPPSGSTFPVGTTSVTCTATDASGNTTTCSFPVSVFSFCLQDDSIDQNVAFVNAITGDYLFCQNGVPLASGTGTLVMHGCNFQIDHTKGNRKVHIQGDTAGNSGMGAGTAYIQKLGGGFVVQITDRKMTDDTCLCAPPPPPPPDPPKKKKKKNQG